MKLRITSPLTRGFLLPEIMLAFSLMTLFLVSTMTLRATMEALRAQAKRHLERLEFIIPNLASPTLSIETLYGNDTQEKFLDPLTILSSEYSAGWGRETCDPRLEFHPDKMMLFSQGINLGAGNASTDLKVRDGIAYLTADSAIAAAPDFYIVDVRNTETPILISSLNTGPGLSSLEVASHYAYVANLGTTHQLQVIDILDRAAPVRVATLKLPLPDASTTAPFAITIFYANSRIYLGTEKWNGNEFAVIDVSLPTSPRYLGGFETGTQINSIYVRGDQAYLADSDIGQMKILDIHDPGNITEVATFSPSGWSTQEGKVLTYFEGEPALGRTTGGFNVVTNHEVFLFSTSTPHVIANSHDVPGGVYGILLRPPYIFLATRSSGHEFQVWKDDLSQILAEKSLGFLPQAMSCDWNTLYFATGDSKGIATLKII